MRMIVNYGKGDESKLDLRMDDIDWTDVESEDHNGFV